MAYKPPYNQGRPPPYWQHLVPRHLRPWIPAGGPKRWQRRSLWPAGLLMGQRRQGGGGGPDAISGQKWFEWLRMAVNQWLIMANQMVNDD